MYTPEEKQHTKSVHHDLLFYKSFFGDMIDRFSPDSLTDRDFFVDFLAQHASYHFYHARDILIAQGDPQHDIYFIVSGAIRCFIHKQNGQEVTLNIEYKPGTPGIAATTLEENARATDWIQAIEDTEMILVSLKYAAQLVKDPEFNRLLTVIMTQSFEQYASLLRIRSLSADDRCLWLHTTHPEMEKRIKKQYLASYLDLDKSVYSRCLKKLNLQNADH